MKLRLHILNLAVAAGLALCLCDVAAQAGPAEDAARLEMLFAELQSADADGAARAEREIWRLWSHSGSAAMDLLLERGRKSMEQGDLETAIQHFSALTDHAPEFAEGWNARATAFFHAGRFGQSVADIQRTLALNPGISVPWPDLGRFWNSWTASPRPWRFIAPSLLYIRRCSR